MESPSSQDDRKKVQDAINVLVDWSKEEARRECGEDSASIGMGVSRAREGRINYGEASEISSAATGALRSREGRREHGETSWSSSAAMAVSRASEARREHRETSDSSSSVGGAYSRPSLTGMRNYLIGINELFDWEHCFIQDFQFGGEMLCVG